MPSRAAATASGDRLRIVYDHQVFSFQQYGGISRYFCEIATRIAGFDRCDVAILAPVHVNEHLAGMGAGIALGRRVPAVPRTGRLRRAANDVLSRIWMARNRPHLVHESYYAAHRLAPRGVVTVVTVYDMIHERFPHLFPAATVARDKARAVDRASHVVCISESTRRDLLDLLLVDPSKVSVVPLAHSVRPPDARRLPDAPPGPYVLYVGQRAGYKNFSVLVRAFAASDAARRGVRLVAFGGGPFTQKEIDAAAALGLGAGRVVHVAGDDRALASLYAAAEALVYPSLYEGFGIPPLEAMALGCPVVCSATGSLPEVVGEAAELVDPLDCHQIAAAIDRVVFDADRAAALRACGRERAALFSWDRCARQTYDIYRRLT
jgi:glycosyltransferase involved in cell wall biosynthesis